MSGANGMPMPVLRLELEAIRERVTHAMVLHGEEINQMIAEEVERQLGFETVQRQISNSVGEAIQKVIKGMVDDYELRRAIQETVVAQVVEQLNGGDSE